MDRNKERVLALTSMCVLFLVGIVCYAAFPVTAADRPDRILLSTQGKADKVIFDHYGHYDGYADCLDCHHMWDEDDESDILPCSECHWRDMDPDEDIPDRYNAFHSQCLGCHEDNDLGLEDCSNCHVKGF